MTGLAAILGRKSATRDVAQADEVRASLDWLMLAAVFLCCIGMVMAVSVSAADLGTGAISTMKAHGARLAVGLVAFLVVAMLPIELYFRAIKPAFWLATTAVYAAAFFGHAVNGAQRWLKFGSFQFQPVDVARFCAVILVARLVTEAGDELREFRRGTLRIMLPPLVLAGGLLLQPDNGNAVFLLALCSCMAIVAGVPFRHFAAVAIPGLVGLIVVVTQKSYAVDRLVGFMAPEPGGQVFQSLVAISSGGVTGQGLGNGWMKMGFVPEAQNDFIFAVICEELGMVGGLLVIGLYAVIGLMGMRLAIRCRERFLRSVVFGFTIAICMQASINLLVVTGMAPAKGIDLPFLSSGGTSLVVYLAAVGLIGNAARADARIKTGRQ